MSKHKVYTLYIIVGVTMLLAACTMPAKQQTVGNKARHQFTNEILLGYTPVKNQGRNPLCWAYSMLATIETEHIMMGDSVNLSVDYVARNLLM